ncbi:hypothetical protein, variant 2 [Aphanomyces astaci]|nr:hypothetical protein, variant 2 [Aphanomyces astaci]ETV75222.1 hypothetical protein, variant 2 [Aphanomyces astaci]|eukprot:XP_009835271.1 hypothetical protein, variant 2 [Aphanomyces astaci]
MRPTKHQHAATSTLSVEARTGSNDQDNRHAYADCRHETRDDDTTMMRGSDSQGHRHHVDDEQVSFKMRLWDYLLRNVHSAVDELYCMCELESSTSHCEDAARVLQSCHDDFIKLMECIRMQSSMSSKSSVAWEVKKGSQWSQLGKPTTGVVVQALERIAKTTSPPPASVPSPPFVSSSLVMIKPNSARPASSPSPASPTDDRGASSPHVVPMRHQKLSLPRKPKRSPSETKLLSEQRLDTVTANKHAIESARLTRIRMAAERMQHVTSRNASSRQKQEDMMWAKLARADRLKQAHLRWIVSKAGSENTKVDEINFIQTLMHQDRKMELQQRLDHVAVRRANLLRQIQTKASLKAESIRAAAKAKEVQLELRVSQIQKRHEGVQARRLKYQQEKKGGGASTTSKTSPPTNSSPPIGPAGSNKRKSSKQPSRHSAASTSHHQDGRDAVMPSLEASVELSMKKNAQRLRDRMRFLTKATNIVAVSPKNPSPPASPRCPPPHIHDVIATAVQQMDDVALHDTLASFLTPPSISNATSHTSNTITSPHDLARLATVPTLRWVSKPTIALALRVVFVQCAAHRQHIDTLVGSNLVLPLVDVLVWALQHWDRNDVLRWAMPVLALCLGPASTSKFDAIREDIGRYIANVGILFRVADRFALVAVTQQDDLFRLTCHFLCALTTQHRPKRVVVRSMQDLRVPVAKIFKTTGLFGMVTLLLASVPIHEFDHVTTNKHDNVTLHSDDTHTSQPTPVLSSSSSLSGLILRALTNMARLDVMWFQSVVGTRANQPRFVHLVRTVLLSARHELLVELLPLLGYYVLRSPPHQASLRCIGDGQPSLLQLLAMLPFSYFSDPRGKDLLFPTLLACCWDDEDNATVLEMNVNTVMLVVYLRKHVEHLRASTTSLGHNDSWRGLAARLPLHMWNDLLRYFEGRNSGGTTRPTSK